MKIYLAAPLFSQMDRIYNRRLAQALEHALPSCDVVLPQDFKVKSKRGNSFNDRSQFPAIFRQCAEALETCDLVLARLDGADVDSGTAYEAGYARGLGKPVLGLRTDYRESQLKGLNLMLALGCTQVVCRFSFNENLDDLARALARRIEKMAGPPCAKGLEETRL